MKKNSATAYRIQRCRDGLPLCPYMEYLAPVLISDQTASHIFHPIKRLELDSFARGHTLLVRMLDLDDVGYVVGPVGEPFGRVTPGQHTIGFFGVSMAGSTWRWLRMPAESASRIFVQNDHTVAAAPDSRRMR
jgi:hypothetical protein